MKHLRLLAALAVAFPALIPSAPAGPATGSAHVLTGDLTLDRAVQTALAQNPEIRKQLQEIERWITSQLSAENDGNQRTEIAE